MHTLICPTCGRRLTYARPQEAPYRPFCSRRCQLVDLSKWFEGRYRIGGPSAEAPEAEGSQSPPSPSGGNPSD